MQSEKTTKKNPGNKNTTRSSFGTPFKLRELESLLISCKKAGVDTLKLGELEVTFSKDVSSQGNGLYIHGEGSPVSDFTTEIKEEGKELRDPSSATLLDKSEIYEMEKAQLLIDDPLGFEQSQIDAHVENQRVMGNA